MKRHLLMTTAAVAGLAAALIVLPSLSAAQAPPMSGGYTNVIAIPVPDNDPQVKAVAGALFKPEGKGPFPAVIYMPACDGPGTSFAVKQQKSVVDHYLAKTIAVLILDSFTPRGHVDGVCNLPLSMTFLLQRADDAYSAAKALAAMPDVDAKRIFLQGYAHGANAATLAINPKVVEAHGGAAFAGVVAFYPLCVDDMAFAAPTLVLVGGKDDWTPAALCEAIRDRPNLEVVVEPDATHAFAVPGQNGYFNGHRLAYDAKAATDAQTRADVFIAAHMKRPSM